MSHNPYNPENMEDTTPELEAEYEDLSGPRQDFEHQCYDMVDDWEMLDDKDVEIDKCLTCGRYRATDKLTYPEQSCIEGCKNSNEY